MTDENTQERAGTGTAGNAPDDATPSGSSYEAEATEAVRRFADSGGSSLSGSDVERLDEAPPCGTVGPGGATIGGAVGGAGTGGTYTAAGTAAGTGGGTGATQSEIAGSPTGVVQASESTPDEADDASAALDDPATGFPTDDPRRGSSAV